MNLLEKMKSDLITAMKEKDKERLTVLRMVKGAIQLEVIYNKKEENEELLIDVVSKQIKMRKESISEFEKGGRNDLIEQTQKEIAKKLHISRSYVSRIEKRATTKILREFIKNNKNI